MIDQFLKTTHGFCAKVDGVMHISTCRDTEREVKKFILMSSGILVACNEPECNCVNKIWKDHIKPGAIEIVSVTIEEGVKVD